MNAEKFLSLNYRQQLKVLNETGKLRKTIVLDNYQYSLYQVGDFYTELKRDVGELHFEGIRTFGYDDLPNHYRVSL